MKPAFSYYGGKQRLLPHILPLIKQIPHTVYGEPFCGGAAVLFGMEKRSVSNSDHYREFINDTNDWVVTFYRVGQTQKEDLLKMIDGTLYSQSEHRKSVQILKNSTDYSALEIAWAFYVSIQMSFSNALFKGWGTSVTGRNQAFTWVGKKRQLEQALDRISDVHISCEDALRCIERWGSPHTLMHVDPPYPGTDQGHYSGYTIEDWQALCDTLDRSDCSYILSNYPQEIEPKSAQQRIEISITSTASGNGKVRGDRTRKATQEELGDRTRTEVIWVCDRSSQIRSDLRGVARLEQLQLFAG